VSAVVPSMVVGAGPLRANRIDGWPPYPKVLNYGTHGNLFGVFLQCVPWL